MAAENHRIDIAHADTEFLGEEAPEARAVENTGHAHDFVFGETKFDTGEIRHYIERVADDDDNGIRCIGFDCVRDATNDTGVNLQQIVTTHAGLAGNAAGNDNNITAFDVGGIIGAGDLGIETFEHGGFHHVECLALRQTFDDVNHRDIGDFFFGNPLCGGGADKAGTEDSNFVIHNVWPFLRRVCYGKITGDVESEL